MNKRMLWSRILCVASVVVSVVGVLSFLRYGILRYSLTELCLLSGSGLIALSAFLGKSRYRTLAYGVLGLAVIEVGTWVVYVGWSTGPGQPYSLRIDGLLHLSYVLSLFTSLAGVMLVLLEFFRAWMESVPMDTRRPFSRIFSVIGLAVMAIGVLAIVGPLQAWGGIVGGFWYFVLGTGLMALGAYLGTRSYRRFLYGTLLVMAALCFLVFIGEILDGMSGGSF
jgi:hypothetical protein